MHASCRNSHSTSFPARPLNSACCALSPSALKTLKRHTCAHRQHKKGELKWQVGNKLLRHRSAHPTGPRNLVASYARCSEWLTLMMPSHSAPDTQPLLEAMRQGRGDPASGPHPSSPQSCLYARPAVRHSCSRRTAKAFPAVQPALRTEVTTLTNVINQRSCLIACSSEVTVTSVSLPPFVSRRGPSNTNQRVSRSICPSVASSGVDFFEQNPRPLPTAQIASALRVSSPSPPAPTFASVRRSVLLLQRSPSWSSCGVCNVAQKL